MSSLKGNTRNPFQNIRRNLRKNKRHAPDYAGDDEQIAKRSNKDIDNTGKGNTNTSTVAPGIDEDMVDEALIEIATTVGDCVTAQKEAVSAMNEQSDKITESEREIKSLQFENKRLVKRLDNIDAAFKSALERISNVERTANTNLHILKNSNIVVEGVVEVSGESCISIVTDIFKEIEGKCHLR